MREDPIQLFTTLSNGLAVLAMLVDVGAIWLCLWHRRLSNWLILVAVGFAGIIGASAIGRLATTFGGQLIEAVTLIYFVASFVHFVSLVLLVLGLGAALADIRRKLSRAMDLYYEKP